MKFMLAFFYCSNTFDFENIVRLVLILSNGNSRAESGFSIIDNILLSNMLTEIIVIQIIIYKTVQKKGGANKVSINPELMKMVKDSHRTHKHAYEEKKQQKRVVKKRKATVDVQNSVANKKAVAEELKNKVSTVCMI